MMIIIFLIIEQLQKMKIMIFLEHIIGIEVLVVDVLIIEILMFIEEVILILLW
jgi:hypothetical protein